MISHTITCRGTGAQFACPETTNVLEGMEANGVTAVEVGCRRGGCGVCRVQVHSGTYERKVMSKAHVSADDIEHGIVLSCRIFPTSDIEIEALGLRPRTVAAADASASIPSHAPSQQ